MKANGKFEHYNTVTAELPNGLRLIHLPFPSEVAYCGMAINTGSRDENDEEQGVAHFIEHLLFKGTDKRRAHHIINRMGNVGGELNAYTTKEETFIYSAFLTEYYDRAMELISDVVFNSSFPEKQIEKEREVILDEINSYIDSPSELIFDDFENLIYNGTELGHYILGTPDLLEEIDRNQIVDFYKKYYRPSNMILFSFGKIPFSKVLRLSEKYFNVECSAQPVAHRSSIVRSQPTQWLTDKQTAQSHVVMGTYAYDMQDERRFAFSLLNNVLGGSVINSRLNNSLREKNGLVYHVESNYTAFTDTGYLSIYYACDKKNREKCRKLIDKELELLINKPLTSAQLTTAKRQYKGQMGIAFEYNENVALRMAKSFLHYGKYYTLDEVFGFIDAVSATDISNMAEELFKNNDFFDVSYK